MEEKLPTLVVLVGPTGIGKTDLAIELAEHFNTEIISADSRQVYSELKIGTAAPTQEQLKRVKHHLIGNKSITEYYSAYEFELDVMQLLQEMFKTKNMVILTGGSMMYIDAVCNGIDEIPTISDQIREQTWADYENKGLEYMQRQLLELDPEFYKQVDLQNHKRVIHAIEVCLMAGKPYSSLRTNNKRKRPFSILRIALDMDRELLYKRIDMRVDNMIADGLEDEARQFVHMRNINSLNTVGYKEMFGYFDGNYDFEEAVRLLKRNTRHYARKQLSWFRRCPEYNWLSPNDKDGIIALISNAINH